MLLEGFCDKDLPVIAINNIQTVVHNVEQLAALKAAKVPNPIKVWLKIDTGMHRLGVALEDVEYFTKRSAIQRMLIHKLVLSAILVARMNWNVTIPSYN